MNYECGGGCDTLGSDSKLRSTRLHSLKFITTCKPSIAQLEERGTVMDTPGIPRSLVRPRFEGYFFYVISSSRDQLD